MRKALNILVLATVVIVIPCSAHAQADYPQEVLEQYWECMERNDLDAIKELLWYHQRIEPIDASLYGLPTSDFDDASLLTIAERLKVRRDKTAIGVDLATTGPTQYPHFMREALDQWYETTGERADCSRILGDSGVLPPETEGVGSGWASDLNLTASDSADRGEVDIVIDYANPNRIIASSCPAGGGETANHFAVTDDWGQTWTSGQVGNNSGSDWECDPVSYYQRSTGNIYHSKVACQYGCSGWVRLMLRKSTNNGQTWSDCGGRPGNADFEDRNWHVVDNTPASACYGNIYITWHESNTEKVARSTDDCASWTNRTSVSAANSAISPDINVAADGHVYVVWQNHGDATFKIRGSSDCGVSWNAPGITTLKARNGDWKNNIPAQCSRGISTLPTVDVDRAPNSDFYGRAYVAMFDFNQTGCGSGPGCSNWTSNCNYDVWLTYSDDEGATWRRPSTGAFGADNITAGDGNQVDNFMGYMRVDEADGSIYIGYHRTTLNPTALVDRQTTHFFVIRSIDGGVTWSEPYQASTLEGNERLSGGSSFERGDYNRLDVYQGVAWPVWVDRRATSGEEEIVVRKVCSEPAHWSERSPTFSAPPTSATAIGNKVIEVSWALPDLYWGDADEDPSAREFELWVDGSLHEGNIAPGSTSTTYTASDCSTEHEFVVRAINQCGISKDYAVASETATGCCENNPEVSVLPAGPLNLCEGTPQQITAQVSGGIGPFDYQWHEDGVPIFGATNATYAANASGTHVYNCHVTGDGCDEAALDPSPLAITWSSAPTFAGIESVTDTGTATCTLDLTWAAATSPCPGPITYSIYRSTTPGFTPGSQTLLVAGVAGTAHSDGDDLVSGTTYYYVVRAVEESTGVDDGNVVELSAVPSGPATILTWIDDAGDATPAQLTTESPWTAAASGGHDGAKVYYTGSYGDSANCAAITTPELLLGAGAELSFWSKYDIEDDWDKGEVQISTDGGGSWTRLEVGYPGYASATGYDLCGLPAAAFFSGTDLGWSQYTVALSREGETVQIRWLFSTDYYSGGNGWWVDDIEVTGVVLPGSCETATIEPIFSDGFESGDTSAWSASLP